MFGVFHPRAEVTGDDARINLRTCASLVPGRRVPVLVDLRLIRSQSAEARALFAGSDATAFTTAVALLIASPLSRVLGNFYLGFNRPQTPTRLFVTEAEAVEWLTTFETPSP